MSETDTIKARVLNDGSVVQVMPDGSLQPFAEKTDWQALREMTDEEIIAAAETDPDARPLSDEQRAKARPVPRSRSLRRSLGLTQEEFAARYHIPVGTLRDWEQGRSEPDQPAKTYLNVIAGDPEGVVRALARVPQRLL